MTIRCEIVSQDRLVYEDDVDIVVLPGEDGEMGILPHHAPLLSTLRLGVIKVRKGGEETIFTVTGGLVEVQPDIVTILADAAENVEEIDIARAEEARKRVQEMMEGARKGEDLDTYLALEAALRRSNLRLDVAQRFRSARGRVNRSTEEPGESR
ncbi:MAG: ATP synthase F1 subunit epsilon [Anaerolineae bacterium]|nr:MAG: ATP synthase F1 subunit epsilon [Anaerolineae bacterium]